MSLGLSSSSFYGKTIDEITDILKLCSLDYIEWSSNHVPDTDHELAKKAASLTKKAKALTAQYNSSFNLFESGEVKKDFLPVIETADILETDSICLRAGNITYENADDGYIAAFIEKLEQLSDIAKSKNKLVSFEFRPNTLFDNYMTTISLLLELYFPNIFINWQPNANVSLLYSLFELKTLIKFVKNVRIRTADTSGEYQSLVESKDDWRQYTNILRTKPRFFLMETTGSPEQLKNDVVTFKDILKRFDKN